MTPATRRVTATRMSTDFRDLRARFSREGKPLQPELSLCMKNASELAIPYMQDLLESAVHEIDQRSRLCPGVGPVLLSSSPEYVAAIECGLCARTRPVGRASLGLSCGPARWPTTSRRACFPSLCTRSMPRTPPNKTGTDSFCCLLFVLPISCEAPGMPRAGVPRRPPAARIVQNMP